MFLISNQASTRKAEKRRATDMQKEAESNLRQYHRVSCLLFSLTCLRNLASPFLHANSVLLSSRCILLPSNPSRLQSSFHLLDQLLTTNYLTALLLLFLGCCILGFQGSPLIGASRHLEFSSQSITEPLLAFDWSTMSADVWSHYENNATSYCHRTASFDRQRIGAANEH